MISLWREKEVVESCGDASHMLSILPSWTEEAGYTPDPDVLCDGNVVGVTGAPPCLLPVRHGGHGAQEGFFGFYYFTLTTISTVSKLEFFQLGSFSSIPSPMISSVFSFRTALGLEFLSLP